MLSNPQRELMNVPIHQPRLAANAVPSQNVPGTIELDAVRPEAVRVIGRS